jgi:oxygen-independent coproporphyrinogen-3 oxidase
MNQGEENVGVYVHFPWCVQKCPYCDFNSHPLRGSLEEPQYLDALLCDLNCQLSQLGERSISSVFFGGGTPSLFGADTFAELLAKMQARLAAEAEITMEANPGTLEHKPLNAYRFAGINRLSLGAQSFNPQHLAVLGRIHSPGDIENSFSNAREGGFTNINLDLMYGLPRQSVEQAMYDLQQAIVLAPEHISWYQLTLEPKTEFHARPPVLPDEDTLAEIEERGHQLLKQAGYQRYEVSAYALDGKYAQHNLNYWSFGDYLGVGAGAHGKLTNHGQIIRTEKPKQPRLYLSDPQMLITHPVAAAQTAEEFMLNALRLLDGVSFERLAQTTGLTLEDLQPQWQQLVDRGLVQPDRIAATSAGYQFLDSVIAEFLS